MMGPQRAHGAYDSQLIPRIMGPLWPFKGEGRASAFTSPLVHATDDVGV